VTALAGVLAVPAGVAVAREAKAVELIDAAYAIPLAAVLGLLAIAFSVGARRRFEWTLGRAGGARIARFGRVLGVLAVCVAAAAGIAIGFFEVLRSAG
jgi:ABC-type multidrug transport system permease subunit